MTPARGRGARRPKVASLACALIAVCASLADCGRPTAPANECDQAHGDATEVVALGDSIAAGTYLSAPDRWTDQLEQILDSRLPKKGLTVTNRGAAGAEVDGLEAAVGRTDIRDFDVAIVIEGVNDVGKTSIEDWAARYEQSVISLEAIGLEVVVGTAPPALRDGQFLDTYNETAARLRAIAGSKRTLLDIDARWRSLGAATVSGYYADLLHQTKSGQTAQAQLAADVLLGLVGDAC